MSTFEKQDVIIRRFSSSNLCAFVSCPLGAPCPGSGISTMPLKDNRRTLEMVGYSGDSRGIRMQLRRKGHRHLQRERVGMPSLESNIFVLLDDLVSGWGRSGSY